MHRSLAPLFGLLLSLGLVLPAAEARATIVFGDCIAPGATVEYLGIAESSADEPLFFAGGDPTCDANNKLDLNPLGFEANAVGPAVDTIDGNLVFTVQAVETYLVDVINFAENGDYHVFGFGADSAANVTLFVRLEIAIATESGGEIEIDYFRKTPLTFSPASPDPEPSSWSIDEDFVMAAILADACSGSGFFDETTGGEDGDGGTGAILAACGAVTSRVDVNIDNTLSAIAENGDEVFIKKKDFDGLTVTSETDPVPEPATAALLALGLVGLGLAGRRRD